MSQGVLTAAKNKGARVSIVVLMLVLALFLALLLAGRPIAAFGSELASAAYVLLVYVPVALVCLAAYRRLK